MRICDIFIIFNIDIFIIFNIVIFNIDSWFKIFWYIVHYDKKLGKK